MRPSGTSSCVLPRGKGTVLLNATRAKRAESTRTTCDTARLNRRDHLPGIRVACATLPAKGWLCATTGEFPQVVMHSGGLQAFVGRRTSMRISVIGCGYLGAVHAA